MSPEGLEAATASAARLPPRFSQRLLHDGNPLDDAVQLGTATDLQAVIVACIETLEEVGPELREAAAFWPGDSGRVRATDRQTEPQHLLKS